MGTKPDQYDAEVALWRQYRKHPTKATRSSLIEFYLPRIVIIAKSIAPSLPRRIELDELVSFGVLGIIDAIGKYRLRFRAEFMTYAMRRIRGAMIDGVRQTDNLRRSKRVAVIPMADNFDAEDTRTIACKGNCGGSGCAIAEYLELLSTRQQEAVILRCKGCTFRQIAEICGITAPGVMDRCQRAARVILDKIGRDCR